MNKSTPNSRISIFLSVNADSLGKYFNENDPAPLYCRQLSHGFQDYLDSAVVTTKRDTVIDYKVFCSDAINMRFLVDPLVRSIRRHFRIKQEMKEEEFRKFKKKNYILLCLSFAVVMFCQGVVPLIFNQEHRIHSMLSNALDVFSWVILWKPIDRLIFYWNPFLKEILVLNKMKNANVTVIENEQELINFHMEHVGAA